MSSLKEKLKEIIHKAPEIDVETAMKQLVRKHHKELVQEEGLTKKLLLINAIIAFQHAFMVGADVSDDLNFLLELTSAIGYGDVMKQFGDEKRMAKMAKMLEQKSLQIMSR